MALNAAQIEMVTELIGDVNVQITAIVLAREDLESLLRTHADVVGDASASRLSGATDKALAAARTLVEILR